MRAPRRLALLVILLLRALSPEAWASSLPNLAGVVRDAAGAPLPGALVSLLDAGQATVATARSGDDGRFTLSAPAGRYVALVTARGFGEQRRPVDLPAEGTGSLDVQLSLVPVELTVTVSASPGQIEEADRVPQAVNRIGPEDLALRTRTVLAQVAEGEVGVHLQRTSPSVAGIYVRGLTGNKVNVFVDGVRYSTAAARGGINTFLDLVDPSTLGGAEILRGPSSTQYGSDAIGGSVQLFSRPLPFAPEGQRSSAELRSSVNTADRGFGSALTAAWASRTFAVSGTAHGRRVGDLRAGDGRDSHNAVTRFLGLPSALVLDDERLPETSFDQYGGSLHAAWAVNPETQVTLSYRRSRQADGKRYDQLLGGDGNLIADLEDLTLDLFRVRIDRSGLGGIDHLSLGYSLNAQREERVNQGGNGNPRANITHEPEKTTVHGLSGSLREQAGRHTLTVGGDYYREGIDAPSFAVNPVTGETTVRRGRVPDEARFRQGGFYVSDDWEATEAVDVTLSARWNGASYRSRAADSPLVGERPLWPDDRLGVDRVTFRAGAAWQVRPRLTLAASAGSGFRAPHVTDLGTLGLTGAGFEVASADIAGLGATVGTTADRRAVSTGRAVAQLKPERSLGGEGSLRFSDKRFETSFTAFVNDVEDNIAKQTLILPPGAVGLRLGDQEIMTQTPDGAVFVGASSSPVLVRTNFGDARIWGLEHTLGVALTDEWRLSSVFTYLRARDKATDAPPNIEGGTPAPEAWLRLRYAPQGRGFWVEPYARLVAENDRLSTLDLEDRRSGATRSRTSIGNFFNNGARARGLVGPGADGVAGNADDVLLATGETVDEVRDRVLGAGVDAAPLFTAIPGFGLFGVRGGARFGGRHEVLLDLENLGDKNYRGVSWGLDGAGRSLSLSYRLTL